MAIASAMAASPALAKPALTAYGLVDMGISHRGDNIDSRIRSKDSIDSGNSMGNRLGLRGVEDLGGGMKALFVLENGFKADTGEAAQMGRLFGRQAFVGLSGNFGMLSAGRLFTPRYFFLMSLDPFRGASMGNYSNVFAAGLETRGENLFDMQRTDNAAAYASPSWHGFSVKAAYSANALGKEGSDPLDAGHKNDGNKGDARLFSFLPGYTQGALDLGISHQRTNFKDAGSHIADWAAGGAYDFGQAGWQFPLKLSAFYDSIKMEKGGARASGDVRLKAWMLGAKLPFGRHTLLASWTQSKLGLGANAPAGHGSSATARQLAAGYELAFSPRTTLYGIYAGIDNTGFRKTPGKRPAPPAVSLGNGYQKGFQFGLRHRF
jgi:predicted porin